MKNLRRRVVPLLALLVLLCGVMTVNAFAADDPTEEIGTKMIECPDCGAVGVVLTDEGTAAACDSCGGTGYVESSSRFFNTFWSLLPPIIAIALALITKEVYSSLFIGIVVGGLLYSNFAFEATVLHVFNDGIVASVTDSYNMGILIFLVILGAMVCLMNKAGGSAAFGRWAKKNIKSRVGAQLASIVLGCLIFIDDYFNCLTVGSVMRSVTDRHQISRPKLAYLIDATAAPICMIAPISSWAAAVSSTAEDLDIGITGIQLFIRAIPYNLYSLMTFAFIIALTCMKFEYGPMRKFEIKAAQGDLSMLEGAVTEEGSSRGRVIDLLLPVLVLIVTCTAGMLYVGGFFGTDAWGGTDCAGDFIAAFGNTDAFIGLPWGSLIALVITVIYLVARRVVSFKDAMACVPKGFQAMISPIIILTLAVSLKTTITSLGAAVYVHDVMEGAAAFLYAMLPAVIFVVACVLAFASGTSWGTFGILIPIVTAIFPASSELLIIGISACCAGAVMGDHCSPISDTTIMSSAGAQCNHLDHVATQIPYVVTVAAVCFVGFIVAGFAQNVYITWIVTLALLLGTLFVIRSLERKKV